MRIGITAVLCLFCLAARPGHAGTVQLPKTGQVVSYYTADDGALQKGVAVSGARFTDNGNGTITDNLTGLVWLKDTHCYTGTQTWDAALNNAKILSSGRCGLTDGSKAGDWRLPNVAELESLIDLANYNPALPTGHPFTIVPIVNNNTVPPTSYIPDFYWTATTNALTPGFAWIVNIYSGLISSDDKTLDYYVWPVRNLPTVQYSLSVATAGAGSGTVTSNPSGISCTGSCTAKFDADTEVTLMPTVSFDSYFDAWSGGGCSGTGNCLVTLGSDTSVTATFGVHAPVNLDSDYYPLVDDAYANAVSGSTIKTRAVALQDATLFNRSITILLKGGFDGRFADNAGNRTVLLGAMKITSGTVRVENVAVR